MVAKLYCAVRVRGVCLPTLLAFSVFDVPHDSTARTEGNGEQESLTALGDLKFNLPWIIRNLAPASCSLANHFVEESCFRSMTIGIP